MVRYKISFEYLGLEFQGSQIQPKGKTVQGEIQKAICTLTKNKVSKIIMSGRTDSKVSALCAVAHFDYDDNIDKEKFLYSLNSILPKTIRIFDIEIVASFHAQKSARYRHYQYKINNSLYKKSVFDLNSSYSRINFDIKRMKTALNYLVGEFDFSAFKSSSLNPSKICTLYYTNVRKEGDYVIIDIIGNRFLYNMVRAIIGTLFFIETKNLEPSYMDKVLKSKKRQFAGANVDPIGLTLVKTGYDDPIKYVNKIDERQ